jgi:ATP:ADP antiporter, AAA family
MRRFGVGALLAIVPVVTFVGFVGLAAAPALLVIGIFEACRRAANHALSKPARETLYTVLPRDEKYKAKSFIDTFVYRAGDTVGTVADKALAMLGAGGATLALPLSLGALGLAVWLGRREKQRATAAHPELSTAHADETVPTTPATA